MYPHAVFFVSFRRRTRTIAFAENQSPNIIELVRTQIFSHTAAAASDGSNDPDALALYIFGFSSATESLNSTGTCTTKHPRQGFLFLPLCPVGKSSPPGLVVSEARFLKLFFFGTLVIMVSAVSTATAIHSVQQLRPHCLFQPSGAGVSALSGAAWPILVHSRLASFIRAHLGSNSNSRKYRAPSSQSRSQLRNQ